MFVAYHSLAVKRFCEQPRDNRREGGLGARAFKRLRPINIKETT